MNIHRQDTRALALSASAALLSSAAHASPIIFTDPLAFSAALAESHVESFEAMPSAPVTTLGFAGAMTAEVASIGAAENLVMSGADGHGAVAMGGSGQFWKLRAGTTTIDLGTPWHAFGFWYSDLEGATLIVTPGAQAGLSLTDHNPGANRFYAFLSDQPFSSVTIAWASKSGDGVGIDDVIVGRLDAPAPGPACIAAIALASAVGRRRKG